MKTILLAAPDNYKLHELIEKNLVHHGYKVTKITNKPHGLRIRQRLIYLKIKFYRKFVRRKQGNIVSLITEWQLEIINEKTEYDIGLFIRADLFSNSIIESVKEKSKKIVSYHYDGLGRSPDVLNKVNLFDAFFVFDKNDLSFRHNLNYNLKWTSNFYFDYDFPIKTQENTLTDFYFLGSHHESRRENLINFNNFCLKENLRGEFDIRFNKNEFHLCEMYPENFHCSKKIVSFNDYLEKIKTTKVIVDFVIDEHNGLSFRVFESIKYQKKLITNNKSALEQDFCTKSNVFVLTDYNYNELADFLSSPYCPLPTQISAKYSFKSWINKIFDHKT